MTRFTVAWLKGAQNQLAQYWVDAIEDKQAIADAANTIDVELSRNPESKGTALVEGLRSLHISPLHVLFHIQEPDRLVEIVSVRKDAPPATGKPSNGQTESQG